MTTLYSYPPLVPGVLVKRYKRFFADVELADGSCVTAHCPNTGPMTGISTPGSTVWLSQSSDPRRKLAYTWELIEVEGTCVGVNTGLPNRIVARGLTEHAFAALEPYTTVQPEVRYGAENSRIDFLLGAPDRPSLYLEVKNTTWTAGAGNDRLALFPDCVTTRGQKHLRELTRIVELGGRAAIFFFINRTDCLRFSPGDAADPTYGRLLREAVAAGVLVLPYRFAVTPTAVRLLGLVPLEFF
jgi:sugar fermentation stimulation protein A